MGGRFVRDARGVVLRDYALAVVLAAVIVIVGFTAFADELYDAYLRLFRP